MFYKLSVNSRVYRVYVFRCQNRVNSNVNSVSGKIEMFDEFDRVNTC